MYTRQKHLHNSVIEELMELQSLALDVERCAGNLRALAHRAREQCGRLEGVATNEPTILRGRPARTRA